MKLFSFKQLVAAAAITLCFASCQDYHEDLYADLNQKISSGTQSEQQSMQELQEQLQALDYNLELNIAAQNQKLNNLLNSKDTIYVAGYIVQRIKANIEKLSELKQSLEVLIQAIAQHVAEESGKIMEQATEISQQIGAAIEQARDDAHQAHSEAVQAAKDAAEAAKKNHDAAIKQIVDASNEVYQNVTGAIEDAKQEVADAAERIHDGITATANFIEQSIAYAAQELNKQVTEILNEVEQAKEEFVEGVQKHNEAVQENIETAVENHKKAVNEAQEAIQELHNECVEAVEKHNEAVKENIEKTEQAIQELHNECVETVKEHNEIAKNNIEQLKADIEDLIERTKSAQIAIIKNINKLFNPVIKSLAINSTLPGTFRIPGVLSVYWSELGYDVTFPTTGETRGHASFTATELQGVNADVLSGTIISDNGYAGALLVDVNPIDADLSDVDFQIVDAKNKVLVDNVDMMNLTNNESGLWGGFVNINEENIDNVKADFFASVKPLVGEIIDNGIVDAFELHEAQMKAMRELGTVSSLRASYEEKMYYGKGEDEYKTYTKYVQSPYNFVTVAQRPINLNTFKNNGDDSMYPQGINTITSKIPDIPHVRTKEIKALRDICKAISESSIDFQIDGYSIKLPVISLSVEEATRGILKEIDAIVGMPTTKLIETIVRETAINIRDAEQWSVETIKKLNTEAQDTRKEIEGAIRDSIWMFENIYKPEIIKKAKEIYETAEGAIEFAKNELIKALNDGLAGLIKDINGIIDQHEKDVKDVIDAQLAVLEAIYTQAKKYVPVEIKQSVKDLLKAYSVAMNDYFDMTKEIVSGGVDIAVDAIKDAAKVILGAGYVTAKALEALDKSIDESIDKFNAFIGKNIIDPAIDGIKAGIDAINAEFKEEIAESQARLDQIYADINIWANTRLKITGEYKPEEFASELVKCVKDEVKKNLKATDAFLAESIEKATACLEESINCQINAIIKAANVCLYPIEEVKNFTKSIAEEGYKILNSEFAKNVLHTANSIIDGFNAIKNDPALLFDPMLYYIDKDGDVEMVSMDPSHPTEFSGTGAIAMVISTLTHDAIVPAYEKFISVTEGSNKNQMFGFGVVLNGSQNVVLFNATEAGESTIKYSLVDYAGNISTNAFYVKVLGQD